MTRRKIAAVLLCAILAAAIAGCGSGTPEETTASVEQTTTSPVSLQTTTASASEQTTVGTSSEQTTAEQPTDLNGYEFILYRADFPLEPGASERDDRWAADVEEIEKRLNCRINYSVSGGNDISDIMAAVIADNNLGDFVYCRHSAFFPLANKGYVKPLDGEEMIAAGFNVFDEETWDQVYASLSKFAGHIWGVQFNGEYFPCDFGDVLAFNEDITLQAGYSKDALYSLVREGKWNYDVFLDITQKVTKDLDGDGAFDQWGMGNGIFQYAEMCVTNGYMPIYTNDSGKIIVDFSDSRYIEALTFASELASPARRPEVAFDQAKLCRQMFSEGKLGFNQFFGPNFFEEPLISAEFSFGILPNPKGPDQENYISVYPDCDAYVCLTTNKNIETSVLIMNELGGIMTNSGWKDRVASAFRDEQSMEIFDTYIFPNTTLNLQNITSDIWQYIRENIVLEVLVGNKTPSQAVEGQNEAVQQMVDAMYNQ